MKSKERQQSNKTELNWANKYRGQTGACQRGKQSGDGQIREGDQRQKLSDGK